LLRPALKHAVELALLLVLAATALFGFAAWRLSRGEISADFLRDAFVQGLERQVAGGHGGVNHIGIVWFDEAKALGVQMEGVWLRDGQGRLVLRAAKVQAAIALDSLLVFAPAPGHMAAEDFFVAVSVSPLGRYELGYAAKGKPEVITGLGKLFLELTSPARRSWAASFLRDLDLKRGQLSLRQTDGSVSWTGDVHSIEFHKVGGLLLLDSDLSIGSGANRAVLSATARASVGLKDASVDAKVQNLNPAKVFPSAGITHGLSALNASIEGRGSMAYGRQTGFQSADVAFSAGSGRIRFGKVAQPFDSARVRASYNPQTGEVEFDQIRLSAATLGLDLKGKLRLIPQGKPKQPARIDFEVTGPKATMAFVPGSEKQTLTNIAVKGRYTPEAGIVAFQQGRASLAGKTVEAKGQIQQTIGKDGVPEGSWGAKLTAKMLGTAVVDQAYPFWPDKVGTPARNWVKAALKKGVLSNVFLTLDIPAGLPGGRLTNDMLQVGFDFDRVAIDVVPGLPLIEDGSGKALVQGDRFDLQLKSGRMQSVKLSEGLVSFPKFDPVADAVFEGRARGDAGEILDILNHKPLFALANSGFDATAFSGNSDVKFSISRPMHGVVAPGDNRFSFAGNVDNAHIRRVALGLDATDGTVSVRGDNAGVSVTGLAKAGPYAGKLDYQAKFSAGVSNTQSLTLDGNLSTGLGAIVPIRAQLEFGKAGGTGRYTSRPASGDFNWTSGTVPLLRVNANLAPGGLKQLGIPVSGRSKAFKASLALALKDHNWRGALDAGSFLADIAFTPGSEHHLLVTGNLTPTDATRFGLPRLPVFLATQAFKTDIDWTSAGGTADYQLGQLSGRLDWTSQSPARTAFALTSDLSAGDFVLLGLGDLMNPANPVALAATASITPASLEGRVNLAGLPIAISAANVGTGQTNLSIRGDLTADSAQRSDEFEGGIGLNGLFSISETNGMTGRLDADLGPAKLTPRDIGWSKAAGQPALVSADIAGRGDGIWVFRRIAASGSGLEVLAQGWMDGSGTLSLHSQRARIKDLFDGQLDLDQADGIRRIKLSGTYLDARRLVRASLPGGTAASLRAPLVRRVVLDIDLNQVRVSNSGALNDLRVQADLTGEIDRRLEASASTQTGAPIHLTIAPRAAQSWIDGSVADLGALTSAVLESDSVRGGHASLAGSFVDGGLDLTVKGSKVRIRNVPVLAQILTLGSLRGFADTLNGSGIEFADIVLPLRLRGSTLYIDDARATGEAIGLTARGKIDLDNRSMDMAGGIAPAYALNSAIGHIPVLGALFISRQGEGVFGLTYSAKGSLTAAKVFVNPFSLATPGMFRRIFDGVPIGKAVLKAPPPVAAPEKPAP
jgi:hypothetical protein